MNKYSRIIRISAGAIVLSTILASYSLLAGEMASQKWVNMRIAQQETNTQDCVNIKISNSESKTDSKISNTEQRISDRMDANIYSVNTNIETQIQKEKTRAESVENTITVGIYNETSRASGAESFLASSIQSEINRAKESERKNNDSISLEKNRAISSEKGLSDQISITTRNLSKAQKDIDKINSKIPSESSSSNKLADKEFVTTLVRQYSATFRGSFGDWISVPSISSGYAGGVPQKNDYITIQNASGYGSSYAGTWIFRYFGSSWDSSGKSGWYPEYKISTEPMTPQQIDAINSGIVRDKVLQIDTNTVNIGIAKSELKTYTDTAISQQETNTQLVVDAKIESSATNIMLNVYALINQVNGTSNSLIEVSAGTNGTVRTLYEPFNTFALGVTNSLHSAITNGALIAYCGNGVYSNAVLNVTIYATATNLVWGNIGSRKNIVGIDMFGNVFGVVGTHITSRKAKEIIGE